jgi:hypothetical protein
MAKQPRPFTQTEERIGSVFVKWVSAANTAVFRATGGRLGATFLRGAPVFLLITKGRKSGQLRTAPLLYLRGLEWGLSGDVAAILAIHPDNANRGDRSYDPHWSVRSRAYRRSTAGAAAAPPFHRESARVRPVQQAGAGRNDTNVRAARGPRPAPRRRRARRSLRGERAVGRLT